MHNYHPEAPKCNFATARRIPFYLFVIINDTEPVDVGVSFVGAQAIWRIQPVGPKRAILSEKGSPKGCPYHKQR